MRNLNKSIMTVAMMVALLLVLSGCVQDTGGSSETPSPASPSQFATISRGSVAILTLDGRQRERPFDQLEVEPGPHSLVTAYPTMTITYHCRFELVFEAGETYEVIERPDRYPVFINRIRRWPLLTIRLERFAPQSCLEVRE